MSRCDVQVPLLNVMMRNHVDAELDIESSQMLLDSDAQVGEAAAVREGLGQKP